MGTTHRAPGSRLAKLERLARERPCPACGRAPVPRDPSAPEPDWARLSPAERDELARLIGAVMVAPCARCGRADHDLARLTDDQRHRLLQLLGTLVGFSPPSEHTLDIS